MPNPVNVESKNEYKIFIEYDNGLNGEVELARTIERNNYSELREPGQFSKVFIGNNNEICWPCGITMCKDALYKQLELIDLMKRLKIDIDRTDS